MPSKPSFYLNVKRVAEEATVYPGVSVNIIRRPGQVEFNVGVESLPHIHHKLHIAVSYAIGSRKEFSDEIAAVGANLLGYEELSVLGCLFLEISVEWSESRIKDVR